MMVAPEGLCMESRGGGCFSRQGRLSSLSICESHEGRITPRVGSHINHAVTHIQVPLQKQFTPLHAAAVQKDNNQPQWCLVSYHRTLQIFFYLASRSLLIMFRDVCSTVSPPLAQQCSIAPASDLCVGGIKLFPLSEPLVVTCCEPYTANVHI